MKRRSFLAGGLAAGAGLVSAATGATVTGSSGEKKSGPAGSVPKGKPSGRLGKSYRIMWDQNSGQECFYNPPMTPKQVAQAHLGFFEGTPVDAYVCSLGYAAGYTLAYPTKVKGMEFIVDRLEAGKVVGGVHFWRYAENIRSLWAAGHDPLEIQVREAQRLGIDYWFRLSMNDWHHSDSQGKNVRLFGSAFYEDHPEYFIGRDGSDPAWGSGTADSLAVFQDFAHEPVRRLRLETAAEACRRYDVDGFEYDYMRCPGYFKYREIGAGRPLMTQLIRDTRLVLDDIGKERGRPIGLSVRVPNTIEGAYRLGLDVAAWVKEDLVDIVVPSTFFNADLEEDISEWAELTRDTPVRVNPAFEEAYSAGHTGGVTRCFYNPPVLLPLSLDMINAIAARHWANGADGLYVFNWFGTAPTYDFDNRPALDDIGDPLRLTYQNKRYVVMRTDGSFPNCLPQPRQIPAPVTDDPLRIKISVADDLAEAGERVRSVRLHVHVTNLTVADRLEVKLNGRVLECLNPKGTSAYDPRSTTWQNYDVPPDAVNRGPNEVSLRMLARNPRLAEELGIQAEDLELAIEYDYPNGPWVSPPGYVPRT